MNISTFFNRAMMIAIGLVLSACSKNTDLSGVKNLASNIFIALSEPSSGEQAQIFVSFPERTEAEICAAQRGGGCNSPDKKIPLEVAKSLNDRSIYQAKLPVAGFSTFSDYLILNKSGNSIFRFRLKTPTEGISTEKALSFISKSTMAEELTFITDDKFSGRLAATPENKLVADYLIEELKRYKIPPAFADYRQTFTLTNGPMRGKTCSNIVGLIEGSDPVLKDQYIVIGAHMDHTGTTTRGYTCSSGPGNDGICNGADDNGSGTIAVLSAAKSLAASRGSLKRSVIIMWFSGEEEGLIGSKYYVANPAVPLGKHVFMINLDMVGYAKTNGNAIAAIGASTSKWGETTARNLATKYPSHKLKIASNAGGGSDHAPFMNKGIPGIFYHTGVSNNPNYHRTSDHVEYIDFDGMLVATKLAFETVVAASLTSELAPKSSLSLTEPKKFVSDTELEQSDHYQINYQYID